MNLTEICNGSDNELSVNFESMGLNTVRSKFLSSSHVVSLSLRRNKISILAPDAFARLPNLCYLDLSSNPLPQLDSFDFELPAELKVLVLDFTNTRNDNYYNYPYDQFRKFSRKYYNIEYLYLRNNELSNIEPIWKLQFPNVKHLYLSNNQLRQESLSNVPKSVTHLYLDYNVIREFNLENIENLVSLSLDGNGIEYINSYYSGRNLHGAIDLESLSLAKNKITVIDPAVFRHMKNLTNLNLSHNQISDLHGEIFLNTQNLRTLFLNHNMLITIPHLCVLQNLESLSLQYNRIQFVSESSFCPNMSLKYLNLAGNQISNLEFDAFQHIKALEVLDLSDNIIRELPVDWNLSLNILTDLYLNDNYIENLDHLFLNNTLALENVYLINNSITTLNTDSLRNIKNLNVHLIQHAKPYDILPQIENPYELQ